MATRGLDQTEKIKLAVVTQGHPYDVQGFRGLLDRMPNVDYYVQDLENWAYDSGKVWDAYDAHLFYNMHYWGVYGTRGPRSDARVLQAVDRLGETEQGILVLHHALLAFPESERWSAVCNIADRELRSFAPGEQVNIEVVDTPHPITRGIRSWSMIDEVYVIDEPVARDASGDGSDILLTTDNPKSMKALAWAHQYKNARVFCYESGHDNAVYTDPSFQAVLGRAVSWLARRI